MFLLAKLLRRHERAEVPEIHVGILAQTSESLQRLQVSLLRVSMPMVTSRTACTQTLLQSPLSPVGRARTARSLRSTVPQQCLGSHCGVIAGFAGCQHGLAAGARKLLLMLDLNTRSLKIS